MKEKLMKYRKLGIIASVLFVIRYLFNTFSLELCVTILSLGIFGGTFFYIINNFVDDVALKTQECEIIEKKSKELKRKEQLLQEKIKILESLKEQPTIIGQWMEDEKQLLIQAIKEEKQNFNQLNKHRIFEETLSSYFEELEQSIYNNPSKQKEIYKNFHNIFIKNK